MSEESPHLLVERTGHVLVCTMNRPERRNALSPEMLVRLADAWKELDENPELRVGVLTGGPKAFCAGADLSGDVAPPKDGKNPTETGGDPWRARFAADNELQWKALLRNWQPSKPIVEREDSRGGVEVRVESVIIANINGGGTVIRLKTLNGDIQISDSGG